MKKTIIILGIVGAGLAYLAYNLHITVKYKTGKIIEVSLFQAITKALAKPATSDKKTPTVTVGVSLHTPEKMVDINWENLSEIVVNELKKKY